MIRKILNRRIIILTTCVMTSASCFAATELARINGTSLSLENFEKKYQENLRFFPLKAPSKQNMLEDLIKRELGVQEAIKAGLDKDPATLDEIHTLLFHKFINMTLAPKFEEIHVTDNEAKSYYKKYPTLRTSHIFVSVPPGAPATLQKQAFDKIKKILEEQLQPGKKTFAEVAQQYSEGPAAPLGGDIDYQNRDHVEPTYYDAALKIGTVGKLSGIVQTQFGYHIIKLTAIRPWSDADKTEIKRLVFQEQRTKIFDHYMAELRSKAKVTVHSELLK